MQRLSALWLPVLVYLVCVALIASLWRREWALMLCLAAIAAGLLARRRRPRYLATFALAAVLGPLAEVVAIQQGAWSYAGIPRPIPVWLPLAWGIAALVLTRMAESLAGNGRDAGPGPAD